MRVFIIAALTVDGFIARHGTHLADWTGPEDKKLFVKLTKEAGTIVMGSRTFATIGCALPGRRNIVYTKRANELAIDNIETTAEDPVSLVARLKQEGAHALAICGGTSIYDLFIQSGVVDELYLTVAPHLFGKGMPLFNSTLDVNLELRGSEILGSNTILLHYSISK